MAIGEITDVEVKKAIAECKALGHDAFLLKYGFGDATAYPLIFEGEPYASKAILGVAHRYLPGRPKPLLPTDFSGGRTDAARRLRKMGFVVQGPDRNPDWDRDELVLALALYATNPASPPRKESREVLHLSNLLKQMQQLKGEASEGTFRNPNGIYLKMMNFRALDPVFTTVGKKGMDRGGALERVVWDEYQGDPKKLVSDAEAIKHAISNGIALAVGHLAEDEDYEGAEGGLRLRVHRTYERDPKLIKKKKSAARAAGKLSCEVCSFVFAEAYGELGIDYIEVHHTKPVHQMKEGEKTKLKDLVLLCSNCHRMAHKGKPLATVDQLKRALSRAKKEH